MQSIITKTRGSLLAAALLSVALLAACGDAAKQNQLAYEACLTAAKADTRIGSASFASFEKSQAQGSTGDADIRVNIPYELGGQKGTYQCIASKQGDGTYKAIF
jgi:hypothetical protein